MLIGLMLIVGSVQAQVSYYCGMMDTIIHDDCCCGDASVDDMMVTDSEPCCEKSVELIIDAATDQAQPQTKPIKFESDVDPPDPPVFTIEFQMPGPDATSSSGVNQAGIVDLADCATYLITQRLRI